jgi:hypothetical protein
MKRIFLLFIPLAVYMFSTTSCVKDRVQPAVVVTPPDTTGVTNDTLYLIDYWNFNSVDTSTISVLVPNYTVNGASITYVAAYYDVVTPGDTANARFGDSAGNGLRMRNPFASITFHMPTTGYQKPLFTFDAESSSSTGPTVDSIYYTLDGSTFINTGLSSATFTLSQTAWMEYQFDLSRIAGATNNPNFAIEFVTANSNTGTSGNDRYDNVTLEAYKQ